MGASANDDSDDTAALLARLWKKLKANGKILSIFQKDVSNFDKQVNIEADNLKISGAGVTSTITLLQSDKTLWWWYCSVVIVMALSRAIFT